MQVERRGVGSHWEGHSGCGSRLSSGGGGSPGQALLTWGWEAGWTQELWHGGKQRFHSEDSLEEWAPQDVPREEASVLGGGGQGRYRHGTAGV